MTNVSSIHILVGSDDDGEAGLFPEIGKPKAPEKKQDEGPKNRTGPLADLQSPNQNKPAPNNASSKQGGLVPLDDDFNMSDFDDDDKKPTNVKLPVNNNNNGFNAGSQNNASKLPPPQ